MSVNRCPKHGVFSGEDGCPWCSEVAPSATEKEGPTIMTKAGQPKGVEIVSKRTGGDGKEPTIETRRDRDKNLRVKADDPFGS